MAAAGHAYGMARAAPGIILLYVCLAQDTILLFFYVCSFKNTQGLRLTWCVAKLNFIKPMKCSYTGSLLYDSGVEGLLVDF